MRESITYKEILEEGAAEGRIEGRIDEARRLVLRVAMRRLGIVTPIHEAKIAAISSLTILEGLMDRIFEVETWDELLRDL